MFQKRSPFGRLRGFTIVELLAVIAIIGLLVALLIPAVQSARAAARRTRCKNNMHQIALAMHSYHEVNDVFPPGLFHYIGDDLNDFIHADGSGPHQQGPSRSCWMQRILPYIEQEALYDLFPFDENVEARKWGRPPWNVPIWTEIPQFMCPSDPANPKVTSAEHPVPQESEGLHGNIVMCAGNTEFGLGAQGEITGVGTGADLNGIFYALSSTRMSDVKDGLSHTAMGSEIILTPDVPGPEPEQVRDHRGRYYNCYRGGSLFSTQFPPNTRVPDQMIFCAATNPFAPCHNDSPLAVIYARSYHEGGANVILADGSVRFVSESIGVDTFSALGSRAGSEELSEF